MPYKYILLVVVFYFISLIQNSFLAHFGILGVVPNFLLVLVCLFTFLDSAHSRLGVVSAISAGVFLDFLGSSFLGISVLAMISIYFFVRKTLVYLVDFPKEYSILYFIPIIIFATVFYGLIINFLNFLFSWSISLSFNGWAILFEILLNMTLGVIGFYIFKVIGRLKHGF